MRKLLLSTMLLACSLPGIAQTFFVVDGIRYLLEEGEEDTHAVVARQDKELSGDITIPATVTYEGTEYNVTRLLSPDDGESGGGGAFQECEITGIILPESIVEIPSFTFCGCIQLSSVTLQGPVTTIGDGAFQYCSSLINIDLPDDVTEMRSLAFMCSGLTQFDIPAGVTELSINLLYNTNITYLEIPATITHLQRSCFFSDKTDEHGQPVMRTVKMFQRDCRLVNLEIDEWSSPFGYNPFGDMSNIDLLVPAGGKVVYQEYYPWMYAHSITEYGEDTGEPLVPDQRHVTIDGICYWLKDGEAYVDIQPENLSGEVTIPEMVTYEDTDYPVTTIFGGAFSQTQVTKVTLPTSIKTIESSAFFQAQKLQEVVLNEGITSIGNAAFSTCPELTTINIPSTVTTLPPDAVSYCPKLTTLTLNEGLTAMEGGALRGTAIETLTIPSTCINYGPQVWDIENLKTLYIKVKEPTTLNVWGWTMSCLAFGDFEDNESARPFLENIDVIVPLGCADSYKTLMPWLYCRSVTNEGNPYLKLNNSVFSAPAGAFAVTNSENDGEPEFEEHNSEYEETYTHGLCLKEGTTVSFSSTAERSLVYVYLFSNNNNTVKLDGVEMSVIGDDQSDAHSYRRYDIQVGPGEHTITCNTYENEEWPCVFLVQVQDVSDEYYIPENNPVIIDGITYALEETVNEQGATVRTATVARQNPNLSGDIVIPEKVSYAKMVLQDNEWVTLDPHDYDVTAIQPSSGESYNWTIDGAFQDCQITSISLPATITTIPSGAFNGCQKLKSVTLPEGVTEIYNSVFQNCTSLEEIYLPETVTLLQTCTFSNCTSLKKVNIPKQITDLPDGFFHGSGIETFIIPQNVTSIQGDCFTETNLKNIKICHESYSDDFFFPENMFNDISGITLIVPKGSKESFYSQVYPWKDFENIIEYTDQNDEHQYNAYSVSYEEEVIGHEEETSDEATVLDYTPSGVDTALPEETEKEDYVLIGWQDKQGNTPNKIMPAQDLLLKLILALLGDANKDGAVDVADFLSVANYILGSRPASFLHKAANISKEDDEIDVADFLAVANIILRTNSHGNSHHARGLRRVPANTDISAMDNAIYIEPTSVCADLEQTLSVMMKNANQVAGFEFCLQLPEGFTVTGASLSNERTTAEKTSSFSYVVQDDGTVKVLCGTLSKDPETGKLYTFEGNDGEVATITISAAQDMTQGDYSAIVTNAKLANADAVKTTISEDVESIITVTDHLVLDENSTVMPVTANDVKVVVKRTINANTWSTICLPFAITAEKMSTAFGSSNTVQLGDFTGYETTEEGGNIVGITVNFVEATEIAANHPYIIKVSEAVTEINVDGVTINPENEPCVALGTTTGRGNNAVYHPMDFIGTFVADFDFYHNALKKALFLNGNNFYYATENTKLMKAFRAYFDFDDVLASVDESSPARIALTFSSENTKIDDMGVLPTQDGRVYTLSGQYVGDSSEKTKLPKGVYVVSGKKRIVK